MRKKGKLTVPIEGTDQGFEIVKLVEEENEVFALVKVPLENLHKLRVLKTDKKRREYQRKAQRKYRGKLATKKKKN